MQEHCHILASVQRVWSVPFEYGVSVRTYVVSKEPAAHAEKPTSVG